MAMLGKVETITREMAQAMIAGMVKNRRLKPSRVDQYLGDMVAGRFVLNGQGLVINEDGQLMDGQNRLTAFLMSGFERMEFFVVRGVPVEGFHSIDNTSPRSLGDALTIDGLANGHMTASIARLAWNYVGGYQSGFSAGKIALRAFIGAHPKIMAAGRLAEAVSRNAHIQPSPFGAVMLLACETGKYEQIAADFVEGVSTGLGLTRDDPRYTLREWVQRRRIRSNPKQTIPTDMVMGATIRAWNAFATSRPLSTMKVLVAVNRDDMPIVGYTQRAFADVPVNPRRPVVPVTEGKRPAGGPRPAVEAEAAP